MTAMPQRPGMPSRPGNPTQPPQTPQNAGTAMGTPQTVSAPKAVPVQPNSPVAPQMPPPGAAPSTPQAGPVSVPAASSGGVRRTAAVKEGFDLENLLTQMVRANGSDLHLSSGSVPLMRVHGKIVQIQGQPVLTPESLEQTLLALLTEDNRAKFLKDWELDFSHTVEGVARFRGNLFRQKGAVGAVFRVIPWEIKPLEALGMPAVINTFSALPRGMVLVTGPTGSGKSTTLAGLVDRVNRTRNDHIITIEDPIEFIHNHKGCVVNQREVGSDTHSFAEALKHVLRQDPDIILVGELRDLETISIALTAAETGHLVFATLHTQSAQDTVNRIIDVFPPNQQGQIKAQLAATLKGVVCQTLVPAINGKGRVAACEVMVVTNAIGTMIRRGETHQIPQALQSGGQQGMQTLNQHLAQLVQEKKISREDAEEKSNDLKDLDALISGGVRPSGGAHLGKSGGLGTMGSM